MVEEAIAAAAGGLEELAADIGVSYGTLWMWANGKRTPNPENRARLAAVLRERSVTLARLARELERGP